MRYLVRSYVTNPTTINAITEIPAKTPSPIGRTDNVFPGSWNALVDAAVPVPLGAELATSGAAIPDDDLFIVVVVELAREDVIVVGRGVLVTVDRPWKGFNL